jgi:subtilisin-like proprotein convertase family protein
MCSSIPHCPPLLLNRLQPANLAPAAASIINAKPGFPKTTLFSPPISDKLGVKSMTGSSRIPSQSGRKLSVQKILQLLQVLAVISLLLLQGSSAAASNIDQMGPFPTGWSANLLPPTPDRSEARYLLFDETETPEPPTPEPTETEPAPPDPTPTPEEEETLTPKAVFRIGLPILINRYIESQAPLPERSLYCSAPAASIPDANVDGILLPITIPHDSRIGDLNVYLDIDHRNIGDLFLELTHVPSGRSAVLIDRPGLPGYTFGCPNSDIIAVLDDEMPLAVESRCGANPRDPAGRIIPAIAGSYAPNAPLSVFDGLSAAGEWTLRVKDLEAVDTGLLNKWCLAPVYGEAEAPLQPARVDIPESARITNISGVNQALPLDCESRSAVDWARYYGVRINEFEFFSNLPTSDNPDAGFVGSVYGQWGQIPPYPYGVHLEPVATLLREYGLPAYAHRPLSWERVKQEVASGNPVLVLVIGATTYNSPPYFYTSLDGHVSQVARYEHSAIIIGYTKDTVTLLDGSKIYTRSLNTFLEGWSALGNLGITASP